jgi:hypothetical protein
MPCPLCGGNAAPIAPAGYFRCPGCDLRFLDPAQHLDAATERARYDLHRNDVHDEGYANFLEPLRLAVGAGVSAGAEGLDFAVMTAIITDATDFPSWYYRRDPTHVVFYSTRTFEWIAGHFGFRESRTHGPRVHTWRV